MAVMQSIVFASAVILVLLVNEGSALRCYECNSINDTRCANDIPPTEFSLTCTAGKNGIAPTTCRKIVQQIEFAVNGRKNNLDMRCTPFSDGGFCNYGSAIRCYECNSYNDTKCADDVPPTNLSVECGDHQKGVKYTFCRKIKQIIEFSVNQLPADTRIIRGCGWDDTSYKNKCYQRSGFGGRQEVCACDQDNCNGSTSLKSSLAALAMSVLMVIAMKN